jgi:hypothetical protein
VSAQHDASEFNLRDRTDSLSAELPSHPGSLVVTVVDFPFLVARDRAGEGSRLLGLPNEERLKFFTPIHVGTQAYGDPELVGSLAAALRFGHRERKLNERVTDRLFLLQLPAACTSSP